MISSIEQTGTDPNFAIPALPLLLRGALRNRSRRSEQLFQQVQMCQIDVYAAWQWDNDPTKKRTAAAALQPRVLLLHRQLVRQTAPGSDWSITAHPVLHRSHTSPFWSEPRAPHSEMTHCRTVAAPRRHDPIIGISWIGR